MSRIRCIWGIVGILFLAPSSAEAAADALRVDVAKQSQSVRVRIRASKPFEFSFRHVGYPERVVVEFGIKVERVVGLGPVNLHPVIGIRRSKSGYDPLQLQLTIDLFVPALVSAEVQDVGKTLVLLLSPRPSKVAQASATTRSPPVVREPVEIVGLRHSGAIDVAVHLHRLLPDLAVEADGKGNRLLLRGAAEVVAQAKQLIAALDVAAANAEVTEAIKLKVLKPDVLAPLLITMFPGARIRADIRLNAVVISAAPRALEQVKGVITTLDVPPAVSPTDPLTEVFSLLHADPIKIASLLLAAVPSAKIRVDPATRSLAVTGTPLALNQIRTLLQKLDVPSPTELTSEVVRARNVDAEAAANVVRLALPGLTVTADRAVGAVVLQGPRNEVERAKTILTSLDTQSQPGPAQLRIEVIPVRYTTPSEFVTETSTSRTAEELAQTVLNALQPVFPEIRIGVDKRGQNLVVTGTPQAIAAAKDLVAKLDVISPQVALEVRVVEVAANTLSNIGISMSPIIGSTYTETNPNTNPMIFGRTPLNITVILNALAEKGQAKILANPTVAAMDGRRALIRTGDDIPLVVRQIFGSTVLENVVTFRAGVTLEIIPKISPDGIITVILKPTVSTITGVTNQGAPQISVREVQTTLMVKDGDTIVIGGLLEERDIIQMTKIPLLGDLPILGRLFRSERKDHRRTELIITVTPRILKSPLSEPPRQEPSAP